MAEVVLGIDIGGTKLAAGVVDADGTVLSVGRRPTPAADGERMWAEIVALLDEVAAGAAVSPPDLVGVGVGCGGPMEWPAGRVSPLNITGWRGFPLRDRLIQRYPGVPVRVHNDALCLVVAEHWRGAGRGVDDMLGMVVSTGVGGGLILGGRLVDGGTGNAGHVGHLVVDPHGVPCACGGRGCLEAYARGPAISAWALEQGWVPGAAGGAAGAEATAVTLAADTAAGDPIGAAAFARAGEAVGIAVASAAALLDIDLVVIGGGISQVGEPVFGPLREALSRYAGLEFTRRVRVEPAAGGQAAGVLGAAALVLAGDRYWNAD